MAYLDWKIGSKTANAKYDKYQQNIIQLVYSCVQKHIKTLNTKLEQNCYIDDYGKTNITNKFDSELSYFVNNIVTDVIQNLYNSNNKLYPIREDWEHEHFYEFNSWLNVTERQAQKESLRHEIFEFNTPYICDKFYTPYVTIEQNSKSKNIFIYGESKTKLLTQDNNCKMIKDDFLYTYFKNRQKREEKIADTNEKLTTKAKKHPDYLTVLVIGCFLVLRAQQCDNTNVQDKNTQPLEYEKLIALKLKKLGFNAQVTKASGDQGADVLAEKNSVSFAIQCKLYTKPVGNKAVQEINTARDFYKKDIAVVVSNADFTQSARTAANACDVILINDTQLEKLLEYV